MATNRIPNILFYCLDELRPDVLGCYGHPFVQTPTLDSICSAGVVFDQAFTTCGLSMPSRNSLFSGLYPSQHGVMTNCESGEYGILAGGEIASGLPPSRPRAFGRILKQAGYRHIVDVGKHHTGFTPAHSGFNHSIPAPDLLGASPNRAPRTADPDEHDLVVIPGKAPNGIVGGTYPGRGDESHPHQCIDKAIQWLSESDGEPWFMRVSINAPHTPVLAPEPYAQMYDEYLKDWAFDESEIQNRTGLLRRWRVHKGYDRFSPEQVRRCRSSYYALTSYVDAEIGRLERFIRERGLDEHLLTIVMSDHGSSVGDHGLMMKGPFDTDELTRIPWAMRYPGNIAPARHEHPVQIIDFVPTLADLLDCELEESLPGHSLVPICKGKGSAVREELFFEGTFPGIMNGVRESVRTRDYLYTRYPSLGERELFDLRDDPFQARDVAADRREVVRDMEDKLNAWRAEYPLEKVNSA